MLSAATTSRPASAGSGTAVPWNVTAAHSSIVCQPWLSIFAEANTAVRSFPVTLTVESTIPVVMAPPSTMSAGGGPRL